ncbi:hypothetical protein DBB36_16365 [Flavobacterium sp. WLB]|nr:hypothetical protein AKO67_21715 [Flavobacterium sp. VMW]OWU88620.1 hypothetical protein APR43_22110 [Flavobacterium sp. NLM]PUU68927.1 hypothetical protein DBB36_16365 [Flavobacterium sp. WLB]
MGFYFIVFWILSLIMIVTCLIFLIIGITYKNYKKIFIGITAMALGILFYYLPYYIVMNDMINLLKNLR